MASSVSASAPSKSSISPQAPFPSANFRGAAGSFELKVSASPSRGDLTFEIMQPTRGQSLMAEYLEQTWPRKGSSTLQFDCKNISMGERKREMRQRGFEPAMEGVWMGRKGTCKFCFFDTEAGTGTNFESIDFSDDWQDPEFEWYPHAPAGEAGYGSRGDG